ncbi:hypothetical protein GCM10025780_32510 [Frondihabitans cladoniiphilus]|uniref:LysM domain-containing protein n=2 Tax=Frondihabitans cladoniiphilus TaxID=715785 RepID=A0ABP8W8U0_9MICO
MNESDPQPSRSAAYRIGRGMLGTVPIVLAGSMAMTLTGPLVTTDHVQPLTKRPGVSPDTKAAPATRIDLSATRSAPDDQPAVELTSAVLSTASAVPTTYTVKTGDTVSSIAGRFGLSTASVLALNGLSWKSTIFPGQSLSLSAAKATNPAAAVAASPVATPAPAPTAQAGSYTIVRGDTLSSIAARHGVATTALLAANGLGWSSIVYPGQHLTIPGTVALAATTSPVATTTVATPTKTITSTTGTAATTYVIKTGDTLSSIAKANGTTVDKLLTANGLSWTSMIYAGKQLTIPSTVVAATVTTAGTGATTIVSTALDSTQQANARTIIQVGRTLGVSDQGIVVALAAAAQESGLRNLPSGDADSVGLFQQRPSQGWGTRAQLTDTTYATKLFFGGSRNPNPGKTRGLLDIRGWSTLTVTQAAQAVQNSAYPDAYGKWESSARTWLATL